MIRCCDSDYDETLLKENNVKIDAFVFDDGGLPKEEVIDKWLEIVDEFYVK